MQYYLQFISLVKISDNYILKEFKGLNKDCSCIRGEISFFDLKNSIHIVTNLKYCKDYRLVISVLE